MEIRNEEICLLYTHCYAILKLFLVTAFCCINLTIMFSVPCGLVMAMVMVIAL